MDADNHSFEVDGFWGSEHWTEWYVNDVYQGESQNDHTYWLNNYSDPNFSYSFSSGTIVIRAEVYDGDWNWENAHRWHVTVNSPPTQPGTIWATNVTATSARVNWGASTDPDGDSITYYVEYKKDWALSWTSAGSTASTYKNLSGLDSDTTYDVRVRAYDGELYSGWQDQENVFTTLPGGAIISAYWLPPLDVPQGTIAIMRAEVENFNIGTEFTFEVYEDDWPDNELISTQTGTVFALEGRYFVDATWQTVYIDDGLFQFDPEYYFEVSYGEVSETSGTSHDEELRVREGMQPSIEKGDFEYSPDLGETTTKDTLLENRTPVILVHGAGSDERSNSLNYWYWWCLKFNELAYDGKYKVYRYVYDSSQPIDQNGDDFAQFITGWNEFEGHNVIILAHSMGGLVARYALNTDPTLRDMTIKLITLGTPHFGSPYANPPWVYSSFLDYYSLPIDELIYSMGVFYNFRGTEGDFDLAWHNPAEIPEDAFEFWDIVIAFMWYNDEWLANAMNNPFTGTAEMQLSLADDKIIAFGGYFSGGTIQGEGNSEYTEIYLPHIYDELHLHHFKLNEGQSILAGMEKLNGNEIGNNDGLVPLESSLLGDTHTGIEKINLNDLWEEPIDHSSYLDVFFFIDRIMDKIELIQSVPDITVTDSIAPAGDLQVPFGEVTEGYFSEATVTVTNDGSADLVIGSIAGTNPLAAPFRIAGDDCSAGILSPGASCTVTVRFEPTDTDTFNDSFDIPSDDPDEDPVIINVSGTGTSVPVPDITVTPSSLDFGNVVVGQSSTAKQVSIRNDGTAVLTINSITVTGTDASEFSQSDTCGSTLTPGSSCTVDVTFLPTSEGSKSANLRIDSDDPDEDSVNVSLSGEGLIDSDSDGVSDAEENGHPNGGDGNNDGTLDSEQEHVTSLQTHDGQNYACLESDDPGETLSNVSALNNPSPGDAPAELNFPYGFFEFTVNDVGFGGSAIVTLYLPVGSQIDTYYKFGPTPGNPNHHWYEFLFDGQTGAEINGNEITLHFVDGERGDDVLVTDDMIIDQGGPGVKIPSPPPTPSGGGGGGGCFIDIADSSLVW